MKNPFSIRKFRKSDALSVKQVALSSWKYTYEDIFTEEEILQYNDLHYSINGLESTVKFMEKNLTQLLVMIDHRAERLIGFTQMGFANFWNSADREKDNEIQLLRIYLLPDYIGKGLGKKLLDRAEEFVKNNEKDHYLVYVHKDNKIGRRFYEKNDFRRFNERDKENEYCYIKSIN